LGVNLELALTRVGRGEACSERVLYIMHTLAHTVEVQLQGATVTRWVGGLRVDLRRGISDGGEVS
jgi:hypothetical protein